MRIEGIRSNTTYFATELMDITVYEAAEFRLRMSSGDITLVDETFYTYAGKGLKMAFLTEIVNSTIKNGADNGFLTFSFTFSAGEDNQTFTDVRVFHSRLNSLIPAAQFVERAFLTTMGLTYKLTAPGLLEVISFDATSTEALQLTAEYADTATFEKNTVNYEITPHNSYSVHIDTAHYEIRGKHLLSFTLTQGKRVQKFVVNNSMTMGKQFLFRNCFNVPETLFLPGTTTCEIDDTRASAEFNGKFKLYHVELHKKYNFIGYLSPQQLPLLWDLLHSTSVSIVSDECAIAIVDAKVNEVSDKPDANMQVSIIYRYEDERMDGKLIPDSRVFEPIFEANFE